MKHFALLTLACLISSGCGPSSTAAAPDADTNLTDAPPAAIDAGPLCQEGVRVCTGALTISVCQNGMWVPQELDTCTDGAQYCKQGDCVDCQVINFSIATMQACSIAVTDTMDAEAFITVSGQTHRVLAMDRWGDGHIMAWCDATTLPQLLAAFDVAGYLGQTVGPRVASIGDMYLCRPGGIPSNPLPVSITYLGDDLPAMYQGNATQLAADWDVIIFCGFRRPWNYAWAAEYEEFVTLHGKGFLAVMEYEGLTTPADFTAMSLITAPAAITFNPLNLPWSAATADVTLDCVPDIPVVK